jgi:sugar phosphate isomerase/epimerase
MQQAHPRFSLNQITLKAWSIPRLVDECLPRGVQAVALWRHNIAETGLEETVRVVRGSGLRVSSVCRGGMFPAPTAAGRKEAIEENLRAIEEAAALDAAVLILVCGPRNGTTFEEARGMVRDGIEAILPYAEDAGVALGIEPLHPMMVDDRSVIVLLREANDLAEAFDHPNVGVAVDVYHLFWDPYLKQEVARAGTRILGYHVSDWVLPIEGGLTSRGMMGDGSIPLAGITRMVEDAGYRGDIEVEVMSNRLWAEDPSTVLDLAIERFAANLWPEKT